MCVQPSFEALNPPPPERKQDIADLVWRRVRITGCELVRERDVWRRRRRELGDVRGLPSEGRRTQLRCGTAAVAVHRTVRREASTGASTTTTTTTTTRRVRSGVELLVMRVRGRERRLMISMRRPMLVMMVLGLVMLVVLVVVNVVLLVCERGRHRCVLKAERGALSLVPPVRRRRGTAL